MGFGDLAINFVKGMFTFFGNFVKIVVHKVKMHRLYKQSRESE